MDAAQYEKAREAALRLLERRRRTRFQVAQRLGEKGFDPLTIVAVCDRLEELKLLDDLEYARLYIRGRQGRPRGERLLLQELRAKGVPPALAEAALAEVAETPAGESSELDRARELARKSLPKVAGLPARDARNKLYQTLARRGFSGDTIVNVIEELLKDA